MSTPAPQSPRFSATLADGDRKGRLGVSYVRAICAQAGIGCSEGSPGEDALAVDLTIEFPEAPVRIQVKAGTAEPLAHNSISLSVTADWIRKWNQNQNPTYLVYVRLPDVDYQDLMEHPANGTMLYAHAYWARIDKVSASPVKLLPKHRFTMDTFHQWQGDILDGYAPRAGGQQHGGTA